MRKAECGSGNFEVGSRNAAFDKLRRGKVGIERRGMYGMRKGEEGERSASLEERFT
jgi:hypothetical protein